jgi:hypothetical protein
MNFLSPIKFSLRRRGMARSAGDVAPIFQYACNVIQCCNIYGKSPLKYTDILVVHRLRL